MTNTAWHADPLTRATGPHLFEVFLEPTDPYSVKTFNKLDFLLDQAGEDKITVKNPPALAALAQVFRCYYSLYHRRLDT